MDEGPGRRCVLPGVFVAMDQALANSAAGT
jgi:hypothetical protein